MKTNNCTISRLTLALCILGLAPGYGAVVLNESGDFSSNLSTATTIQMSLWTTYTVNGSLTATDLNSSTAPDIDTVRANSFGFVGNFVLTITNYVGVSGGVGSFEIIGGNFPPSSMPVVFSSNGIYHVSSGVVWPFDGFRISSPYNSSTLLAGTASYSLSFDPIPEPSPALIASFCITAILVRRRR